MPAKFVVKKGSTGKYRFNLVASNGQVIATSEAYETRAKALSGIESVRKNAAGAVLVDGTAPAAKPAAKPASKTAAGSAAKPAAKAQARTATKTAAPAKSAATKAVRAVKKVAAKATS